MSLFAELQHRKVFKVGAAYLVIGWLLIQVAATVGPQLNLPEWAPRLITFLILLGFPIALVMAWVFDVTPEGVRLDASVSGSKRVFASAAVIAAIVLGWYWHGFTENRKPVAVAVSPAAATAVAPQKSIAVLAFTDLSQKRDQEYFSDGIAEELLNSLAQVKDLKVAGRTSSFYYKGRNEDLRTIGKALGVANVLEGSVRTQGDKVRITAQLIRSADGFHLWSDTFDGELTDVFKLQENIARAITDQLKVVLVGDQKTILVPTSTNNAQAYALYLQARMAYRARGKDVQRSIDLYHAALALDPKFAQAWAGLCGSLNVLPFYLPDAEATRIPQIQKDAEAACKQALDIAPDLASAHIMLGNLYTNEWRWAEADSHFQRAQILAPADPEFYFAYTDWLGAQGRYEEALQAAKQAVELDPMAPMSRNLYGYLLAYSRRIDESIAQLQAGYALAPTNGYLANNLIIGLISAGRIDDAAKMRDGIRAAMLANGRDEAAIARRLSVIDALRRIASDPSRYAAERKALGADGPYLASVFPEHIDDLFVYTQEQIDQRRDGVDAVVLLRSPLFAQHHSDPRYLRLLDKAGFDDKGNIR